MQWSGQALQEHLLSNKTDLPSQPSYFSIAALPLCMICSAVGMMTLKIAQTRASTPLLISGYVCEIIAFGVYPLALHYYTMRFVSVCWAGSSIITAVSGGYILFNELPNIISIVGCFVVIIGIILASS